jgi:hypothetical protein
VVISMQPEMVSASCLRVMPGAVWKTWEPVYADSVAHGKLVLDLAARIQTVLKNLPSGSRTATRKLKSLCKGEGADKNSWLRALNKAIEGNPQYSLEDRSILVLAS